MERRALTGAWIETVEALVVIYEPDFVAPSRARGLKLSRVTENAPMRSRSRPHGRVD